MTAADRLERVTVYLTPTTTAALDHAAETTGDSKTDIINRAIQAYSLLADKVADGSRVLVQPPDDDNAYASTRGEPGGSDRTPCSVPECNTDGAGEPCTTHEREQAHAEGEHAFCGAECDPTETENPAQHAAREIQALHDPIVIGYVIGLNTLTLTLHPNTWQEWQAWQERLGCPIGQTTYRGGSATAHGMWGHIPVHVHCVLDRLPKATEPGDGA